MLAHTGIYTGRDSCLANAVTTAERERCEYDTSEGESVAFGMGGVGEGKEENQGRCRWRSVRKERSRSERSKEDIDEERWREN